MKVLVLLGTRPEIVRLSQIVRLLQQHCELKIVDTGQCFDYEMSGIFYHELGYDPGPEYNLMAGGGSFGEQMGKMFPAFEEVLKRFEPDKLLTLGDTNSALVSIVARRRNIPICHLEAGNRCFNEDSPEEVNRKIIDHCVGARGSHLCYTERSRANLLREGIPIGQTYVVGNPVYEVLEYQYAKIENPEMAIQEAKERVGILAPMNYAVVTAHRQENVDCRLCLESMMGGIEMVAKKHSLRVIFPVHPRTRKMMEKTGIGAGNGVTLTKPMGFTDFNLLLRGARLVISDSGTVSEESAILGVPCCIIRETTERQETMECGNNILTGIDGAAILRGADVLLSRKMAPRLPDGYAVPNVSEIVSQIVLG